MTGSPRRSFEALAQRPQVVVAATSVLLPLAVFLLMRPDTFGIVPNGLDPFFYTGYSFNFSDIMSVLTDDSYFVSRWTAYLPPNYLSRWLPPSMARLLVRWCYAALVLGTWWAFAKDLGYRLRTWVALAVIGMTMPAFVRAFMTDYVEYVVVALGTAVVFLAARRSDDVWRFVWCGVLGGAVIVANPVATIIVTLPVAGGIILLSSWKRRILAAIGFAGAVGSIALLGLLLFRWRYGIDNVYQPTIDFLRSNEGVDTFRSRQNDWARTYLWIYMAPFVLLAALVVAVATRVRYARHELMVFACCAIVFVLQCLDQWWRKGIALEVSYYWSYVVPLLIASLFILVGRSLEFCGARTVVLIVGAWVAAVVLPIREYVQLPAAGWFALFTVAVLASLVLAVRRESWTFVAMTILVVVALMQVAAPTYAPTAYHPSDMSPRYDDVFLNPDSDGARSFAEGLWFMDELDRLQLDHDAEFVVDDPLSNGIAGLYGGQAVGYTHAVDEATRGLSTDTLRNLFLRVPPLLVLYGSSIDVPRVLEQLAPVYGDEARVVLDETHSGDHGYRLVAISLASPLEPPLEVPLAVLDSGLDSSGDDVLVSEVGDDGFLSDGPQTSFVPGRYRAVVSYSASGGPEVHAAEFDVHNDAQNARAAVSLVGTSGVVVERAVDFSVPADAPGPLGFRTVVTGDARVAIYGLRIEAGPEP